MKKVAKKRFARAVRIPVRLDSRAQSPDLVAERDSAGEGDVLPVFLNERRNAVLLRIVPILADRVTLRVFRSRAIPQILPTVLSDIQTISTSAVSLANRNRRFDRFNRFQLGYILLTNRHCRMFVIAD